MLVQPYLFFDGRCEEAVEFYRRALGAEVTMLMRFKDSPDTSMCPPGPGSGDKVMHASFRIGETTLMASDGCSAGPMPKPGKRHSWPPSFTGTRSISTAPSGSCAFGAQRFPRISWPTSLRSGGSTSA